MPRPAASRTPRPARAASLALAAALVLAGCSGGGLGQEAGEQAREGDSRSYVAGDGSVATVAVEERGEPVELAGETTDGSTVDVADWRGDVVVLNVWYAACPPCRKEAPDLAAIAQETATDGVRFLGINTEDDAATAQAFERTFATPYPSLLDAGDGSALLALRGTVPPQAVPSTVVLDAQGRPAARVLGIADPSVLSALVQDVRAESGPAEDDQAAEGAAVPAEAG
ncbi:TlpA disulfide reductase family protein [Quadrisphaera sp. DSM 44207]|uniref:TlpA family protein disulfide reductase n=1 Tax=Quadrisphaera sp. DSM 44207 TaxID=1881057 RepID=UPI00088BCE5B|nr:TlpA disulfide reductase family protein [Quadrisphaera sp. DSM 44207]SDQ15946.1 Thiol-disulfide isomerase or thioredoxin [Quadrisphaera sp. DSM 44207]